MSTTPTRWPLRAPKTGIEPFDRVWSSAMTTEPDASAYIVYWIVDNCSPHASKTSSAWSISRCTPRGWTRSSCTFDCSAQGADTQHTHDELAQQTAWVRWAPPPDRPTIRVD